MWVSPYVGGVHLYVVIAQMGVDPPCHFLRPMSHTLVHSHVFAYPEKGMRMYVNVEGYAKLVAKGVSRDIHPYRGMLYIGVYPFI